MTALSMAPALAGPIVLYTVVTSITPGPNNLMLLSSGVRFGVRRSVPHVMGISIGAAVMVALTGLGLAQLFVRWPVLHGVLQGLGMAYLLWLAWQLTRMPAPREAEERAGEGHEGEGSSPQEVRAQPLGFWGAAAFQWVNPKLWVMALGLYTTYVPAGSGVPMVLGAAALFGVINLPCVSVWAGMGQALRRSLRQPRVLKAFNWSMAVLLLASMAPAWMH
jgi:threonine/homoserine/homoserine lactone efflux protein